MKPIVTCLALLVVAVSCSEHAQFLLREKGSAQMRTHSRSERSINTDGMKSCGYVDLYTRAYCPRDTYSTCCEQYQTCCPRGTGCCGFRSCCPEDTTCCGTMYCCPTGYSCCKGMCVENGYCGLF